HSCRKLLAGSVPGAADIGGALGKEGVVVREERAPDAGGGGNGRQARAEGFERHPAVIAGAADRAENGGKIDVAAAGDAAIVLGDMDDADMGRDDLISLDL